MISSRVTVMGSSCSLDGTQSPSPGPPNGWACNLNLRTGRPRLGLVDGIHDLGGMQCFGRVVAEENERVFHHDWERRVFGLNFSRLGANVDEFRDAMDTIPPA